MLGGFGTLLTGNVRVSDLTAYHLEYSQYLDMQLLLGHERLELYLCWYMQHSGGG
jgi:hypothetical protein